MQTPKSTKNTRIKVLLVENCQIIRAGLKLLLEKNLSIQVVGEIDTPEQVNEILEGDKPDVILFSPTKDCEAGLANIVEFRNSLPAARVLLFVRGENPEVLRRAISLGVSGIVKYAQTPEILLRAVERIFGGEIWIERSLMAQVLGEFTNSTPESEQQIYEKQKIESLTPKENQVIGAIGEGLRNKEIAKKLHISEATVRHHLSSIFSKLEVEDRLSLVIYAYQRGLIDAPKRITDSE